MTRRFLWTTACLLAVSTLTLGAQAPQSRQADAIREAILRLPYYGVFDALMFSYEKGTVTLEGFAYRGTLRTDAERAIRRVQGVDQVVNNVVDLPPSSMDDDIRWRTFYAIYTNAFLSRYVPGGGLMWGNPRFRRFDVGLGMQPIGRYPIHIIVQNGRVRLIGVVDNAADKTAAEISAKGVPGSFSVESEITVRRR